MRNNYVYIILLLSFVLASVGCQKNPIPVNDTGAVVITMDVHNNVPSTTKASPYASQSGILGQAEYVINKLRVYVFNSEGELDKMEVYDDLNANHVVQQTIEVPKDKSKDIYFVANEPESVTAKLEAVTSAEELAEINFTIADAMNKGFNAGSTFTTSDFLMPMTSVYRVDNAKIDLSIYVGLERAVARVDLYLKKSENVASRTVELSSSSKFSVSGLTYGSTLFPSRAAEPNDIKNIDITASGMTLTTTESQRAASVYVAERTYNSADNASKITFSVEGMTENGVVLAAKTVTLGVGSVLSSPITEIKRNYVYSIYATYNGEELDPGDFVIQEWKDVELDAEIEGVMVAVDAQVAMDWLRNGNSFTSKPIFFGSNKPISIYLPIHVANSDKNIPDYEFKKVEFPDMSAGKSYNLKDVALDNNYIFVTSWVESAKIHFTSPQSGYFEFTYAPSKVNFELQSYPIRIKSDNVTKQMKAVYDNGYIPASSLSDAWAKRAKGGVIFAKRGVANHPVSTPEILVRDSDGYYRGDYATTAAEADKYCKEKFGTTWYVPSTADMLEIAEWYDELGVSYRLQNNGSALNSGALTESAYWTSQVSSSEPSKYWSADFMSRDYMINNFLNKKDGAESHFVRCVMDLQ